MASLVVLLDKSKLLAEYAALFFDTKTGQDIIRSISYTSTMPMWTKSMLEMISVPEISIEDQKKTIAKANALKETIKDATNKLNSLFD